MKKIKQINIYRTNACPVVCAHYKIEENVIIIEQTEKTIKIPLINVEKIEEIK